MDFKDASSVSTDPLGKQQHVVEVLNVVDVGSSQLLEAEVREDFTAETTLAQILRRRGRPSQLTCDRDPRLVASAQGSDFPSAFRRFLSCLDIDLLICPPQRPDRNAQCPSDTIGVTSTNAWLPSTHAPCKRYVK